MSEPVPGSSSASSPADASADPDVPRSAMYKLFDIRLLIGGLFVVYGVLLTVAGFFTSEADLRKASNININLWLGLGMLTLGLLFLLWRALRPLRIEPHPVNQPRPVDRP